MTHVQGQDQFQFQAESMAQSQPEGAIPYRPFAILRSLRKPTSLSSSAPPFFPLLRTLCTKPPLPPSYLSCAEPYFPLTVSMDNHKSNQSDYVYDHVYEQHDGSGSGSRAPGGTTGDHRSTGSVSAFYPPLPPPPPPLPLPPSSWFSYFSNSHV
jgi:hypothetical protein